MYERDICLQTKIHYIIDQDRCKIVILCGCSGVMVWPFQMYCKNRFAIFIMYISKRIIVLCTDNFASDIISGDIFVKEDTYNAMYLLR